MGEKMKTYCVKLICLASLLAVAGCASSAPDYRLFLAFGPEKSAVGTKDGYARGKANFEAGQFGLAVESFHAALLNEGRRVETLNGLAAAYDNLGRFDLARRYYEEALALDPNSAVTLHNLGYSHLLQGDLDEALRKMQAAYALDDESSIIRSNLQVVLAASQRRQNAPPDRAAHADTHENDTPAPPDAWIQRDSVAVQTLVTTPRADFLVAVQEARVDPRLIAHEEGGEDWLPQFLGAGMEDLQGPSLHQRRAKPAASVEVSNGYGRRRMAARMARYLGGEGFGRARLTNQKAFDRETSVIYCRAGYEAWARQLAGRLPLQVPIVARKETGRSDVVLVLGADLSDFDRELLARFAEDGLPPKRRALAGDHPDIDVQS
jgi:tetratricopeptide (TPR) repeat protein